MTSLSNLDNKSIASLSAYGVIVILALALGYASLQFLNWIDSFDKPFDYGTYLADKNTPVDAAGGPNFNDNRKVL